MTLRQYLITMIIATLLCWGSWFFVLINIDPYTASILGHGFFYITIFFALVGTNAILIFGLYKLFLGKREPLFRYVQKSFRDACFLSVVIVLLLVLQAMQWLNVWSFSIFLGLVILLGLFLLSLKRQRTAIASS